MNAKIDRLAESIYTRGYDIYTRFFEEAVIDRFLDVLSEKENQLKRAGIGKEASYTQAKEIRSDKILWLSQGADERMDTLFFKEMEDLKQVLNRRCFLGLNAYEFHFAKYEPGTFYKRHKDSFSSDDARKISVIAYLNKNWKEDDGGELKIYTDEETITVKPEAGTLVIFESHIEHEVVPSNTNRYSITGWLKSSKGML